MAPLPDPRQAMSLATKLRVTTGGWRAEQPWALRPYSR
jgi:hypothetical protein